MKATRRIRDLIDAYYGGNVSLAAKAIGIPQATLASFYHERVSPRAGSLVKIAAHFGTTMEWLRAGTGQEPIGPPERGGPAEEGAPTVGLMPLAELQRWYRLLEKLHLHPEVEVQWRMLPSAVHDALHHFRVGYDADRPSPASRNREMINAMAREAWAWTIFVESWRKQAGDDSVRNAMNDSLAINAARLGFSWYGIVGLRDPEDGPPLAAMLEKIATKHGLSDDGARKKIFEIRFGGF